MYLTNRFFWIFGALTALFALAYPFGWLFPLAQMTLGVGVAVLLGDILLLFARKPRLVCERRLSQVFSLSDPNEVTIALENQGNIYLNTTITDELPVQFQRRDFEVKCALPPGQPYLAQHTLRPLSRGVYAFGNINLFVSTRIGLVERKLVFKQPQDVDVYPSIIQMKKYELRAMQHIAHETGIKKMRRIDHHRRQPGTTVALPDDWDAEQQPADAHLTPDELLQAAQRERGVQQALAELPAEQARVLRLSFFDEQPHSRIAQELGIPLGTVKSRIRLAAAQLRRLLERHQA